MAKILSKSGDSLADVYDIEGSIAGIEELQSKDVNLVHEMGGVLMAERLVSRIIVLSSGDINQNTDTDLNFSFSETTRLLGVQVVSDVSGRIQRAVVSISTPPAGSNTDMPIWVWNTGEAEIAIKMLIAGSTSVFIAMVSDRQTGTPNLLTSQHDPGSANIVTFRARSTGFGAGTVAIQCLIHVAFPAQAGVRSRGLPLPGW